MGIKDALVQGKNSVAEIAGRAKKAAGAIIERARPSAEQAAGAAVENASRSAGYVTERTKEFLATPHGKKVAAGAAAGATLGVPLPVLGPISGALVGAAVGWWVGLKDAEVLSELEKRCRLLTPTERQQELATLEDLHAKGQLSEERYREGRKALTGL